MIELMKLHEDSLMITQASGGRQTEGSSAHAHTYRTATAAENDLQRTSEAWNITKLATSLNEKQRQKVPPAASPPCRQGRCEVCLYLAP